MQALSRPATLTRSALAAGITVLACLPRLLSWVDRPMALGLLAAMLGLCSFVLWAFVIAWLPAAGHHLFVFPRDPTGWLTAGAIGLGGAGLLATCVDPTLRGLTPLDYPRNLAGWLAGTLFTLAFVQLFLCFAPFALFLRLFRHPLTAALATVFFGVFLLALQIRATPSPPSASFTAVLLAVRLLGASLSLFLLLRGGLWLVWASILLIQVRLLPGVLAAPANVP